MGRLAVAETGGCGRKAETEMKRESGGEFIRRGIRERRE